VITRIEYLRMSISFGRSGILGRTSSEHRQAPVSFPQG
jgi:hypothetical protein